MVEVTKATAEHYLSVWGQCVLARSEQPDEHINRPKVEIRGKGKKKRRIRIPPYQPHPLSGEGSPYILAGNRGIFRPADDPEPEAFIFLQVENCFLGMKDERWLSRNFAFHYYAEGRSMDSFRDANLELQGKTLYQVRKLKGRIIEALKFEIGKRPPETISEAAVEEAKRLLRANKIHGFSGSKVAQGC